jgi:hypothetical protein
MIPNSLEVGGLRWRTARRSANNGACVEVAPMAGTLLVRDSQDQAGPVVAYAGTTWRAFLIEAKQGQFDLDRL